jgi:glyoxylase-like metal-dependent hydrolase (beta-lactamase superfamily II)
MQFGDLTLTTLFDGTLGLDGGAMFGSVPKTLWEKRAPADARNRIRLATRPLLVQGERTLLIDAGIGGKMDPKSIDIYAIDRTRNLDHSLTEVGVARRDIDIVLASHLHFDHAGGFTERNASGALVPTFPRARYVVRTAEWDDAAHTHERNRASYRKDDFVPLADAGVLDLVAGDRTIMPGVRVVRTGGHTKNHQIIVIESRDETAIFVADLIPTTAHIDEAWIMGYDLYPMDTLEFKRSFVREAIDREYLIFFEHDPDVAAGYIREVDGRKRIERVL